MSIGDGARLAPAISVLRRALRTMDDELMGVHEDRGRYCVAWRLLPLTFGRGLAHDTRTGTKPASSVTLEDSAKCQRGIQLTLRVSQENRSAVKAAFLALEFSDD